MPSSAVQALMEHVSKLREEVASLKTDIVWIKRGLYIVGTAAAGQAASALVNLFQR